MHTVRESFYFIEY